MDFVYEASNWIPNSLIGCIVLCNNNNNNNKRLCPRGCTAAIDSEHHVLFECLATRHWPAKSLDLGADELRSLMDRCTNRRKWA
jgi:hypothetical protein